MEKNRNKSNPIAKTLADPKYRPNYVRPRKGKGSYDRKRNKAPSDTERSE